MLCLIAIILQDYLYSETGHTHQASTITRGPRKKLQAVQVGSPKVSEKGALNYINHHN